MSTNDIVDMMTMDKQRSRREHSAELKALILAECEAPGASVAKVAMIHGVNANLVHGWRKLERERRQAAAAAVQSQTAMVAVGPPPASPAPFLPVAVMPDDGEAAIEIEVRRGGVTMKVSWPMSAASQCAAWARELLK